MLWWLGWYAWLYAQRDYKKNIFHRNNKENENSIMVIIAILIMTFFNDVGIMKIDTGKCIIVLLELNHERQAVIAKQGSSNALEM